MSYVYNTCKGCSIIVILRIGHSNDTFCVGGRVEVRIGNKALARPILALVLALWASLGNTLLELLGFSFFNLAP